MAWGQFHPFQVPIQGSKKIYFVKISDDGIDTDYSSECLPTLVHFKDGEPTVFPGDLSSVSDETNIKRRDNKYVVSVRRMASRNGFLEK